MRSPLRVLVIAAMAVAAACDGGGNNPGPPPPDTGPGPGGPPSNAIEIFGGERLGWNQTAPSLSTLRSYTFNFYVDRSRSNPALSDVRCGETSGAAGYECSGLLPTLPQGPHVLQLSTMENGRESPLSAELSVTVVSRLDGVGETSVGSGSPEGAPPSPQCFVPSSQDCYDAVYLARNLGQVRDLAAASHERIYFIEGGRHVRVLASGRLVAKPVFSARDGTIVSSLAVDPGYAGNRFLYLAITGQTKDGGRAVNVVRYRDVGNALGEAATLVADLPAVSPDARIALDADQHLYVAMPAREHPGAVASAGPYDGLVLRFNSDGTVPRDARGGSPVFARGYARPTGLIASSGSLWLAGTGRIPGPLGWIDVARNAREWPRTPRVLRSTGFGESAVTALIATPGWDAEGKQMLLLASESPPMLHRLMVDGDVGPLGDALADRLLLPSPSPAQHPTAVETLAGGDAVVALVDSAASSGSILHLRRR